MKRVTPQQKLRINFINFVSKYGNSEAKSKESVHLCIISIMQIINTDLSSMNDDIKNQIYFFTEIADLFFTTQTNEMNQVIPSADLIVEEMESLKQWGGFEENCLGFMNTIARISFNIQIYINEGISLDYLSKKIKVLYDLYQLFDLDCCIVEDEEYNNLFELIEIAQSK